MAATGKTSRRPQSETGFRWEGRSGSSTLRGPKLPNHESAAQCEMAVYTHARHVARLQFRCGCAADIGLEGDIVRKIPRELQNVGKNDVATAEDTELHYLVSETVARSNTQTAKVVLGYLHLSGEAIIPYT